jgi:hypothetical protein
MSIYLQKMKELTLLIPERKTLYFRKMGEYKKFNEETQQIFDKNAELIFTNELSSDSNFQKKVLSYLKNINLFILLILILWCIGFLAYLVYSLMS